MIITVLVDLSCLVTSFCFTWLAARHRIERTLASIQISKLDCGRDKGSESRAEITFPKIEKTELTGEDALSVDTFLAE